MQKLALKRRIASHVGSYAAVPGPLVDESERRLVGPVTIEMLEYMRVGGNLYVVQDGCRAEKLKVSSSAIEARIVQADSRLLKKNDDARVI